MSPDMQTDKNAIRIHLLWPVSAGVLLLLVGSVIVLTRLQHKNINAEVEQEAEYVSKVFYEELDHETQDLRALIEIPENDPELQRLWLARDRQALLNYADTFYRQICLKQDITHYYFHDTDRACFLRVHQPELFGDRIQRFTLDRAVQTGQVASGIELGPLGTFTLRVVKPFRINGQVCGYLELGKEIEHLSRQITDLLDVELLFVINKDYLDRARWEEGMRMVGRQANWDEYRQFVLISSSLEVIPEKIHHWLGTLQECDSEEHLANMVPDAAAGEQLFHVKCAALLDAGGRDVGDILVLVDIKPMHTAIHRLSAILIGVYAVMFIAFVLVLYFYFGAIRRKLNETYRRLNCEIDEHKQTKSQIEQQNRFLNNIIESLRHPFYILDVDTFQITMSNTAAADVNLSAGRTCHLASHGLDRPCDGSGEPCPLQIVKKTRQPAIVEHAHHDRSGGMTDVEVHCYPVFDEDGRLTHAIEYSLDITARKTLQKKLEEARNKAEEASRLKSEFLANMSHEIRTPLNAIIGFGDLLMGEESLGREQREYAETLVNNGHLLLTLINNILDLSKIEAGKIVLEFEDLDMQRLCKNLNGVLRPLAERKDIAFDLELADDLKDIVQTDQFRLQQCLMNLGSNAIKFTAQGSVTMRFFTEEILGKKYFRIDVKDSGIGIPESKLDTIFEAFTQVDGSTSRQFGGTGLGLTITRKLVTMMGGEMFVSSKPGQGSVFSIQLPLEPGAETARYTDGSAAKPTELFLTENS